MTPRDRKRQDWRHNDRPGRPWHASPPPPKAMPDASAQQQKEETR